MALCKYAEAAAAHPSTETETPAVARDLGVGERTIRRHRAGQCCCTPDKGGTDEGVTSYTLTSARAWGYEDFRKFIASTGQDPDRVTFNWGVTSNPAGGFWNKLNNVRPKGGRNFEHVDLPALYAAAEASTPRPVPVTGTRGTVIVYADPQVGKTGRRGGTKELIERSTIIRAKLDTYGTELFKFVNTAHKHAPVTVAGVPSNHTAWRNGKQNLGRPSDDLGLLMHTQVQYRTEDRGMDVAWFRPDTYDESVAVDLLGTRVGLVHGNQFAPGQGVSWWEKQTFGAQAAATADILVHGHYHTFSSNVAGRNPHTGRQRWCLGAPTLDNGSDWYRQVQGRDSDPGLLVFDVTENGFDLASLTIITA